MNKKKIIASIKNIRISFKDNLTGKNNVVIRDTGFDLYRGEILGLIGESGSGKSVISSLLNGLLPRGGEILSGKISILGHDVTNWKEKDWLKSKLRGRKIGRVFQNPMSALTPTIKIKYQLIEALLDFKIFKKEEECIEEVIRILDNMDIENPKELLNMYPHELSGGMIQRVVLTMIISLKPEAIILDEPTTALDPIVQSEILTLIKKLNKQYNISFIFITHDIGVISEIADRVAIMYAGRIIEYGDSHEVLFDPRHPYTWGLLCSLPSASIGKNDLVGIKGILNQELLKDDQDAFVFRNPYAMQIDTEKRPPFFKIKENHYAATWLLHPNAPKVKKPEFIRSINKLY
ncbi:MAG: ABC transporter ATP-binding protein [Mycoplasmatales bacterium]|nr:ABC transporter ATP-binding protein [Mycoplasmatales bacterium]